MKQITDNPELYQQLVELYGKERADKMIADRQQKTQAIKDTGVAYKSQRPTVTLADLQRKAKALSASIKDVAETAAAQAVRDLLDLAYKLDLNEEAVLRLVTQYGMSEVMGILTTLSQQKAAKGYLMSPFYGRVTKIDVADLKEYVTQAAQKSRKTDSFWK